MKKKIDKPTLLKEKPQFVVIEEATENRVEKLFEIYAKDKAKARAYYYTNNVASGSYTTTRTVAFEYSNGDVRIARINKRYGISVTNKMFSGESNDWAIIYKKNQDKYYFQRKYTFKGFSLGDLGYSVGDDAIRNYLCKKFPVLRTAFEQREKCHYFGSVLINVIARKKIFSEKAMLRHIWGTPYKVAEVLMKVRNMDPNQWVETRQALYNVENIREGFFDDKYFRDTRKFAAALGKKINCAWSEKRLKLQHDIWAKEVVEIILEFEELRNLSIRPIYHDFADFSGIEMLLTNHDLISEGRRMSHCVGTYSGEVDAGRSAIYTYGIGTLELGTTLDSKDIKKTIIYIKQFRGYDNKAVPSKDYDFVKNKVNEFNNSISAHQYEFIEEFDELPF
jgi:hypothetical protein